MGGRIGGGFERPDRQQSKEDLRNRFLAALSSNKDEKARRVLEDLHGEPFRLYLEAGLGFNADACTDGLDADGRARKRARELTKHKWNRSEWRKFEDGPITYDTRKETFRQSLFEWSRRNKLDAAWCREYAFETLDCWSYSQPAREHLRFRRLKKTRTLFSTDQIESRFRFEGPLLHPQLKSLEETETELREAFELQLSTCISGLKSRAKNKGYVPTPEIYKSKYRKHYYRWLVEWAINGKPIKTIAEETKDRNGDGGPDNKTVRDAVNRLAADIELPLQLA